MPPVNLQKKGDILEKIPFEMEQPRTCASRLAKQDVRPSTNRGICYRSEDVLFFKSVPAKRF